MPSSPVHEIEKLLLPAEVIVTVSDPEVPVWVVQLAEQVVALVDDQVSVEVLSNKTEIGSADKLTAGGVGVLPPPPQETINKILIVILYLIS